MKNIGIVAASISIVLDSLASESDTKLDDRIFTLTIELPESHPAITLCAPFTANQFASKASSKFDSSNLPNNNRTHRKWRR